jgi:MFS family permease
LRLRCLVNFVRGLQYVRASPVIRTILVMMAVIGTFTYEFSVSLPLFAEVSFGQGPATYAAMTAAMGLGAVVGGLYVASQGIGSLQRLTMAALLFGTTVLLAAVAPTLPLVLLALVAVGFCSIGFTSLGNAALQLTSAAEMRGGVMALWTVAFLGSTPIGAPVIGAIGEHVGRCSPPVSALGSFTGNQRVPSPSGRRPRSRIRLPGKSTGRSAQRLRKGHFSDSFERLCQRGCLQQMQDY